MTHPTCLRFLAYPEVACFFNETGGLRVSGQRESVDVSTLAVYGLSLRKHWRKGENVDSRRRQEQSKPQRGTKEQIRPVSNSQNVGKKIPFLKTHSRCLRLLSTFAKKANEF